MSHEEQQETAPTREASQLIVVGFDVLSDTSDALTQALAFATLIPKTHVEVVWVPPMAYVPESAGIDVAPLDMLNKRVTEVLEGFGEQKLRDADVRVSALVGEGRPAQALSRIAFLHEAQMIIVGSHDKKTSLERMMLGSVTRRLIDEAPCPVMVMRPLTIQAVPEIEKPPESSQARRRIALGHRYHAVGRNVQARENMPLLFPMETR